MKLHRTGIEVATALLCIAALVSSTHASSPQNADDWFDELNLAPLTSDAFELTTLPQFAADPALSIHSAAGDAKPAVVPLPPAALSGSATLFALAASTGWVRFRKPQRR